MRIIDFFDNGAKVCTSSVLARMVSVEFQRGELP